MLDTPLPAEDLEHVLAQTLPVWSELRATRVFVTGATGFFGQWLLQSFAFANRVLGLGSELVALSRDPGAILRRSPHLAAERALSFHQGDVSDFAFPGGEFSHVIHAATPASATLSVQEPLRTLDTIVNGTRHTLEFARHCRARKLLHTSSGAVYGRQPPEVTHLSEDLHCAPDTQDLRTAYGNGKRLAEHLCAVCSRGASLEVKNARCFAFIGPHLPLDGTYAIGNFLRDGLAGKAIQVTGDGTPYRSYLHAADLMIWLWTILVRGPDLSVYNVGSDQAMTIGEVAERVARRFGLAWTISGSPTPGRPAERYVPSIRRAQAELGLRVAWDFDESLDRTVRWLTAR